MSHSNEKQICAGRDGESYDDQQASMKSVELLTVRSVIEITTSAELV